MLERGRKQGGHEAVRGQNKHLAGNIATNLGGVSSPFVTSQGVVSRVSSFHIFFFLKVEQDKENKGQTFLISGEFIDWLQTYYC